MFYILAHHGECELIVGNAVKVSDAKFEGVFTDSDGRMAVIERPAMYQGSSRKCCTCDPKTIELIPSDGSHSGNYVMPTVVH